jgi:ubiquinone biosynthesis protein
MYAHMYAQLSHLPGFAALITLAAGVAQQSPPERYHIPGYLVPVFVIFGGAVAFTMLWFIGAVTGRLLGLRPPWWRMLIEAYLGGSLGAALASSVGAQNLNNVSAPLVYFSSVLIASMLFMVVIELVLLSLSPASDQLRGATIPNPIRAIRRRLARGKRYLQIMGIVTRHGLGQYLSGRRRSLNGGVGETNARRLWARVSLSLAEAGGAFVKLGQVLSTRSDLLPPEAIAELSRLQDNAPPASPSAIEALLTEELGAPPSEVFAAFDHKPVAAASIAQAHLAELATGERVIVKVQRPGIREPVERDLDILIRIAHMMERRALWARRFGVTDLAEGFAASLREELNFRVEARNIAAVAASLDNPQQASQASGASVGSVENAEVRIPRVFGQHSTDRVLVIELLDGVNVREAAPLIEQLGLSRAALARTLLRSLLRQILGEGTFHADPHPGNVMVLRDGRLALIDFGSVGRLDPLQQAAIKRMLAALDRRNAALLTDALLDLAQVRTGYLDEERLERALAQLMAQRLGPGMEPGPELFVALFALLFDFGLAFPPVIGGVFRALVTAQGTISLLDPKFQALDEARSIGAEWMQDSFGPTSLRRAATDEVLGILPLLQRLPRRLDRITAAIERNQFSANIRLFSDPEDARLVSRLVSRAVMAFMGVGVAIASVLLLGMSGGPRITSTLTVFQLFGYSGLFGSVVLLLRVLVAIARERVG